MSMNSTKNYSKFFVGIDMPSGKCDDKELILKISNKIVNKVNNYNPKNKFKYHIMVSKINNKVVVLGELRNPQNSFSIRQNAFNNLFEFLSSEYKLTFEADNLNNITFKNKLLHCMRESFFYLDEVEVPK